MAELTVVSRRALGPKVDRERTFGPVAGSIAVDERVLMTGAHVPTVSLVVGQTFIVLADVCFRREKIRQVTQICNRFWHGRHTCFIL